MSSDANTNVLDIIRWILLVPVWVVVWFFVPYAYYRVFGVGASWWTIMVLPYTLTTIVEFFVIRAMAPSRKNAFAIIAVVCTILLSVYLYYGLSNMAY